MVGSEMATWTEPLDMSSIVTVGIVVDRHVASQISSAPVYRLHLHLLDGQMLDDTSVIA